MSKTDRTFIDYIVNVHVHVSNIHSDELVANENLARNAWVI